MNRVQYVPPYQRVVSLPAIRALLLAQLLTFFPFISYMPKWFVAVFVLVSFWRLRVMHGQLSKPPLWLILFSMVAGISGVVLSGLGHYSLDSAVAFCVLGYLLKSLEVLRRRDGIIQVYLGFFLAGVYLLYRFDPIAALIMLGQLFVNLIALQALTSERQFYWRYAMKYSAILILGAIPVMVAGYLFFPRIPPLWNIPNEERGSVTGMSDEMSPGSVAELARSNEPAFRVSFNGPLPPRNEWYWRGTTLSRFDGKTWKAEFSASNLFGWPRNAQLPSAVATYDYTVIMENSGQRWLYFLDWPTAIQGEGVSIIPDARGAKRRPLNSVYRYSAQSSPLVTWPDQSRSLKVNLQLPSNGNNALRQWSVEQRHQVATDQEFINTIVQYIRTEPYYYTLRPPLYQGLDSIEDFWFGERRGFCEHYATALTFILRSAGIPARLVGGYLGGNYVEAGNYIQVRQMEAHAWVEAWLDGRWQRIDPTAAVAPDRVDINVDDLFIDTQPSELTFATRFNRIALVNRLAMYWDSLNYQWQVLVLDYDNSQAIRWFEMGFGRFSPLKMAIAVLSLLGIVALILGFALGMIRLPKRRVEPFRSLHKLSRWYGDRAAGETLGQYIHRLLDRYPQHTELRELGILLEESLYDSKSSNTTAELRIHLKKLNKQRLESSGKSTVTG